MLIVCVRADSRVIKAASGQGRAEFKLLWVTKMNLILLLHRHFLGLLYLLLETHPSYSCFTPLRPKSHLFPNQVSSSLQTVCSITNAHSQLDYCHFAS